MPKKHRTRSKPSPIIIKRPSNPTTFHIREQNNCIYCKSGPHELYHCVSFKGLTVDKHHQALQKLRACHNCLGLDHDSHSCPSNRSCRECGKRHHTLLHRDVNRGSSSSNQAERPNSPTASKVSTGIACIATDRAMTYLLMTCTATIEVRGCKQKARALIDPGATFSLVTNRLVNSLNAKKIPAMTEIAGISQTPVPCSKFQVVLDLCSTFYANESRLQIQAAIVDVITGELPEKNLPDIRSMQFLQGLQLADPQFHRPGRIDLLLGMDVYTRMMRRDILTSKDGLLEARDSRFGWVLRGTCSTPLN